MLFLAIATSILGLLYETENVNGQGCSGSRNIRLSAQTDVYVELVSNAYLRTNDDDNRDCGWLITAAKGWVVMVNFTKFSLPNKGDFLALYDGAHESRPSKTEGMIGYYSGAELPPDMFSSDQYMAVILTRNWRSIANEGQQFKLTYKAVKPRPDPTICSPFNTEKVNKNIIIPTSAGKGVFYSPLYPNPYPSNIECMWTISVPGKVWLYFEDFHLEGKSVEGCSDLDIVQVNLSASVAPSPTPLTVHTLCGMSGQQPYMKAPTIKVTFKSNLNNKVSNGFNASWEQIEVPNPKICSEWNTIDQNRNIIVSSPSGKGEINDPSNSYWYPRTIECRWQITVPEGSKIKLSFGEFSVWLKGDPDWCGNINTLFIYDGGLSNANNATLVKTICGEPKNRYIIHSTGRFMTLEYRAESAESNTFSSKWEQVNEAKPVNVAKIVGIVIGCLILIAVIAVVTRYIIQRKRQLAVYL